MLSKEYLKEVINSPASELTIVLASELLSLREQLEVMKNQEPIAYGLADKNDIAYYNECCIGDKGVMEDEASNYNYYADSEDDFIHVIPLFTTAKPAEE